MPYIKGRPLDQQQRTAISSDEDNSLVIFGSGKTTTIVGKVAYLQLAQRKCPVCISADLVKRSEVKNGRSCRHSERV